MAEQNSNNNSRPPRVPMASVLFSSPNPRQTSFSSIFLSDQSSGRFLSDSSYEFDNEDDDMSWLNGGQGAPRPTPFGSSMRTTSTSSSIAIPVGGYRMWSARKVRRYVDETVGEVASMLSVPTEAALVLLRRCRGEKDTLANVYVSDQQADLLDECGLLGRCGSKAVANAEKATTGTVRTLTCSICFDDEIELENMFGMHCGHQFCKDCWREYLATALTEGTPCVYTSCPQPKCREVITELEVTKLVPEVLAEFGDYQLRSYVDSSWNMRWCPGPSCGIVVVGSPAGLTGDCRCLCCQTWFCLRCGEAWHAPATCEHLAAWNEDKDHSKGQTEYWMLVHTKKCPSCKTPVEKNGGCSHMTCTQCWHDFCWLCLQDWSVHGYDRACNQFELERAAGRRDPNESLAEDELMFYVHCFDRFVNHANAETFARGELERFTLLQENNDESATVVVDIGNVVKAALEQLIECRRVLKYTYIAMYNLKDEPTQKGLLEEHQALLERFTESLSEHTEKDPKDMDRGAIANLTGVLGGYVKKILDFETN